MTDFFYPGKSNLLHNTFISHRVSWFSSRKCGVKSIDISESLRRCPLANAVLFGIASFVFTSGCRIAASAEAARVSVSDLPNPASADLSCGVENPATAVNRFPIVEGPYCGVSSLRVCLAALGHAVPPVALMKIEYIGSHEGSSAGELVKAASDFGVEATCYSNLNHTDLRRIHHPMILHLRSNWASPSYDHWGAFLGCDGPLFRIHDGSVRLLSASELLGRWDGTAIGISTSPASHYFLVQAKIDSLLLVLFVFLSLRFCAFLIPVTKGRSLKKAALFPQLAALAGVALVLACGFHAHSNVGFFRNSIAVADVVKRFYSETFTDISMTEVSRLLAGKNAVLIDARRPIDFQRGALPGAINIPVDASMAETERALAQVDFSDELIIYCHTEHCDFADRVATFLKFSGYDNIFVYRNGYIEWMAAHEFEPFCK